MPDFPTHPEGELTSTTDCSLRLQPSSRHCREMPSAAFEAPVVFRGQPLFAGGRRARVSRVTAAAAARPWNGGGTPPFQGRENPPRCSETGLHHSNHHI